MKQSSQFRFLLTSLLLLAAPVFLLSAGDPDTTANGKALYEKHCNKCHGANGDKGFFGAKDLHKSILDDEAITSQVLKGKRFMPSFRKRMTPEEIQQVVAYVKTLRNNQHDK